MGGGKEEGIYHLKYFQKCVRIGANFSILAKKYKILVNRAYLLMAEFAPYQLLNAFAYPHKNDTNDPTTYSISYIATDCDITGWIRVAGRPVLPWIAALTEET